MSRSRGGPCLTPRRGHFPPTIRRGEGFYSISEVPFAVRRDRSPQLRRGALYSLEEATVVSSQTQTSLLLVTSASVRSRRGHARPSVGRSPISFFRFFGKRVVEKSVPPSHEAGHHTTACSDHLFYAGRKEEPKVQYIIHQPNEVDQLEPVQRRL